MAELDFHTLNVTAGVVLLTLTGALLHERLARRTYPGFGLWVAGAACASSALLMDAMRGGEQVALLLVVANGLGSLSIALVTLGFEDFLGRPRSLALQALAVGATVATSAFFTSGVPSAQARIACGDAIYAVQAAWCLWLARGVGPLLGARNRLLEGALAVQGGWSAMHVALLLAGDTLPQVLRPRAGVEAASFLLWAASTAVLVFALSDLDLQRVEFDLRTTMEEIRTLRGIIPICSFCKKIRDDAGAWQAVEKYVSERTEAEFSHGICPRCMAEQYPGM